MDAPDPQELADLLRERHALPEAVSLSVQVTQRERRPRLIVALERAATAAQGPIRHVLDLTHLRGGPKDEAWRLLVDATDALFGQLIESGFAHRDLPTGTDVRFEDGTFWVDVQAERPDLEAQAERWLSPPGRRSPPS